jgi:tetratricopeptide (TPR) repeat protein
VSRAADAELPTFPEFKSEAARDYLRAVVRTVQARAGTEADACLTLARIRGQLGEKDEAERLARRVLDLDPGRADAQVFLAGLLILEDRMEEAGRLLRQAVERKPDIPGGYRQLGMVLDRLGDREGARKAIEMAVRQAPDDAATRMVFGRLLLDQGEIKDAIGHLEKACQLDPQLAGAFYALSQGWNRLGETQRSQGALETYQRLKQKERADLDAWHINYDDEQTTRIVTAGIHAEAAGLFMREQHPDLAESHLRQAMRIAPQEVHAHELLAALLLREGRLTEARGVYETLVNLRPRQPQYHLNLGTLFLQLKDYPAAVNEWKRALELDPRQPEALNNLARFCLAGRRDLPEALAWSRQLADLQPTAANQDLLGWALYANGQTNEARVAAARAVELDPTNAVYRERFRRLQSPP